MSQLQSTQTFADTGANAAVNAARLTAHVNGAILLNGAVNDQTERTAPLAADTLLVGDSLSPSSGAPLKVQLQNLLLQSQRDGTQQWGGVAGGAANVIQVVTIPPRTGSYQNGEVIRFITGGNANTGPVTFSADGRGVRNLFLSTGTALVGGELPAGTLVEVAFDGSQFVLVSVPVSSKRVQNSFLAENARGDTQQYDGQSAAGSANVQTISPAGLDGAATYTSYQNGIKVQFKAAFTNTNSMTLGVDNLGARPLVDQLGNALIGGEIQAGGIYTAIYDLVLDKFVLLSPRPFKVITTGVSSLAAANNTYAHGLGVLPTRVRLVFVCLATDGGYAVGAELDGAYVTGSAGAPLISIFATSSVVGINLSSGTTLYAQAATGGAFNLNSGKWSYKFYIEV